MEKLRDIKTIAPNKDILEMIRMIIKQNDEILSINRVLAENLSNPMFCIRADAKEE